MDNPAHNPPVVAPACTGVDLGKEWLTRGPGFVTNQVLVKHVGSVRPANLDGLNHKIPAVPCA